MDGSPVEGALMRAWKATTTVVAQVVCTWADEGFFHTAYNTPAWTTPRGYGNK